MTYGIRGTRVNLYTWNFNLSCGCRSMVEKLKEVVIMAKPGAKLVYELDEFKRLYLELKKPGVSDSDIADKLAIDKHTLWRYKKNCGIVTKRLNTCGLTEEHLQIAEQNGISRSAVFQRRREYNWPIQRAITQPMGKGRFQGGEKNESYSSSSL